MVVILSTDETNDYSGSIGTTWPPAYDEDNDRIKGFYTEPAEEITDLETPVERLRDLQEDYDADRITCRALIEETEPIEDDQLDLDIEAMIDLDGRWQDYVLVYLGDVEGQRMRPAPVQQEHERIRAPALETERTEENTVNGYRIEQIDEPTEQQIGALQELYQQRYTAYPIDFTEENIRDLFTGDNVVATAYQEDDLIGAYVAEVADIPLETEDPASSIRMAELTEAATARDHEGQGIGTALGQSLLSELATREIDMVYGEARADLVGVNISAARMGRQYDGTLPNHCHIGGDTDDLDLDYLAETLTSEDYETMVAEPFGSLNVWSITNEELTTQYR